MLEKNAKKVLKMKKYFFLFIKKCIIINKILNKQKNV